jgi:hypothetical protein
MSTPASKGGDGASWSSADRPGLAAGYQHRPRAAAALPFPGAASPDLAPYVSKNGPERERYSDTDASWGHRSAVSTRKGGGFYGYRIHASVCTATDLPVAWTVATAREHESLFVAGLLDTVKARGGPRRARSKGL